MDEMKKLLVKIKETYKKMKYIKYLQKQVKKCSNLDNEIKKIYADETNIEVKKKLLISRYLLIEAAQIINDRVGKILNEFDIYVHSDL